VTLLQLSISVRFHSLQKAIVNCLSSSGAGWNPS